MIREVIVTTLHEDGSVHLAPMGIREEGEYIIIAPFKPSATLNNLERDHQAVVNMTDNVMVFAGCLTGQKDWPLEPTGDITGFRLRDALAHIEVQVEKVEEDELRPRYFCRKLSEHVHAPFQGFNRAQAAVLEAAILVSRLNMLPAEKINQEIEYLRIAIDKTAGANEKKAWGWLIQRIEEHKNRSGEVDIA